MNNNINGDYLSKLSHQVKSFQQGFEILAEANRIEDLGMNFYHIIRGSLLITDVHIFFKDVGNLDWDICYSKDKEYKKFENQFPSSDKYLLEFLSEEKIKAKIVLPLTDGASFGLILGAKLDGSDYSEIDKIALQIFLQLLDNAYQSLKKRKTEKELIFSLNHRVLQLNSLIDTSIEISKLQKKEDLLDMALERAAALTNASKALLKILKDGKLVSRYTIPYNTDENEIEQRIHKIASSFNFNGVEYNFLLADKESRTGNIAFDDTDGILLDAFARQVQVSLENEFLHQESLEKQIIKKELLVASAIQKKIIPEKLPEIPGYKICGVNIPSKEVGGDYYDCIPLEDGKYALVIADVTGKGVGASLLVSTLNASLKSYLDVKPSLQDLAVKLNKMIYNSSTPDKFITFFMAILEPKTGILEILNAGHNPSLILRKDKSLQKLDAGGVAFGMFDMGLPFTDDRTVLESEERLLLFTDGIPEAMNQDEEEYSDDRLESFFQNVTPNEAWEFIKLLLEDVKSFTKDTPQSDDITALYLIRE